MPSFSQMSLSKLRTCEMPLQYIFVEAIKDWDCTVVCGHRGKADQHKAFLEGNSEKDWPNSKHNTFPSQAIDVIPYYPGGIRWKDKEGMYLFAGYVLRISHEINIKIRWGGDWDGDHDTKDQKFNDLVHFELVLS